MKNKFTVTSLAAAALASLFLIGGQSNTAQAAKLDESNKSGVVEQKGSAVSNAEKYQNTVNTKDDQSGTEKNAEVQADQNKLNTQNNQNNSKVAVEQSAVKSDSSVNDEKQDNTDTNSDVDNGQVDPNNRQSIQQGIDDINDKIAQTKDVINSLDNTKDQDDTIQISDVSRYKEILNSYSHSNGHISKNDIQFLMNEYARNQKRHNENLDIESEDQASFDMDHPNKDQIVAMSLYTQKLINNLKSQLGLAGNKVSNGSIQFAYDIANAYNRDYNSGAWRTHWHDVNGIKGVAKEYGLPTLADPKNQAYEAASFGLKDGDAESDNMPVTLAVVKNDIFGIINGMIFGTPGYESASQEKADNELGHAFDLLNLKYPSDQSSYISTITTYTNSDLKSKWPEGYHFLAIPQFALDRRQSNPSKGFDTTEVTYDSAKQTANDNLKDYQAELAELQNDLAKLDAKNNPTKGSTDNNAGNTSNTTLPENSNTTNSNDVPSNTTVVANNNLSNNATAANTNQSVNTSTQNNTNNAQESSNANVKQDTAKKSFNLKLIHSALVYNRNGHVAKVALLKKSRSLKTNSLKTVTINGKKFLKIGDNQYVKAVNTISDIIKKNTKARTKTKRVRLYTSTGRFTKKYTKKTNLKFTAQRLIKGQMFYRIAKKNLWVKATDLVF